MQRFAKLLVYKAVELVLALSQKLQGFEVYAIQKLQDDMVRMQQEQANKIVTPDDIRGGNDIII